MAYSQSEIVAALQRTASHSCSVIMPLPFEDNPEHKPIPTDLPDTFRLSIDYMTRLKECKCFAGYRRYNRATLQSAYDNNTTGSILPRFLGPPSGTDIRFFHQKLGTYRITKQSLQEKLAQAKTLPRYYNWSTVSSEITPSRSQAMCSSCYAFSVADCLSDLFVIQNKIDNPQLSPTYILSCYQQGPDSQCKGGGDPVQSVLDIQKSGIGTYDCLDYSFCGQGTACSGDDPTKAFQPSTANSLLPKCECKKKALQKKYFIEDASVLCIPPNLKDSSEEERTIINGYLEGLYQKVDPLFSDLSTLHYTDIQDLIKQHIYEHGPVIGGFHVFKNFFRDDFVETNGIYVEHQNYLGVPGIDYNNVMDSWYGTHAVVIVGWGSDKLHDETVPYWIVRNSWGPTWGDAGYFKIAMYGNDPTKKYQNRLAQFEYPTILLTNEGISITGGVIMMKPGKIETIPMVETPSSPLYHHVQKPTMMILIGLLMVLLWIAFRSNIMIWKVVMMITIITVIGGLIWMT